MFARYKRHFLLLFLVPFTVLAKSADSAESFFDVKCDSRGECAGLLKFERGDKRMLCEEGSATLMWKKAGNDALLTCNSFGTEEDRNSYFISRGGVTKLTYGRSIRKDALFSHPDMLVPDKFSAKPVCSPADIDKLKKADFTLLKKRPNGDGYCYEITYLKASGNVLNIELNGGEVDRNDLRYFGGAIGKNELDASKKVLGILNAWRLRNK